MIALLVFNLGSSSFNFFAIPLDKLFSSWQKLLNATSLGITPISLQGKRQGYSLITRQRLANQKA